MTAGVQAIGRDPCAPLARVPGISEMAIKRALDAGNRSPATRAPVSSTRPGGRRLAAVAAALLVLSAVPAPAPAQPAWRWIEVPGARLDTVPDADPHVMAAWGGAAWDSRERRLLIWGGGHGDSYDNSLYYLDPVNGRAGRLSPRSPRPKDLDGREWGRNNRCIRKYSLMHPDVAQVGEVPVSRHTYDLLEYLPGRHWFFATGGSMACGSGGFATDTWTFDLERRVWRDMEPSGVRLRPARMLTVYDPKRDEVVGYDGGRVLAYSPARNEWRELRRYARQVPLEATAALDPGRRLMVIVGHGGTSVIQLDGGAGYDVEPVTTSGATEIERAYPGVDHHPALDRIVAWGGGIGTQPDLGLVHTLALEPRGTGGGWRGTWRADRVPGHPTRVARGVNGKFRWAPELDAFVVATSIREPLHLLKAGPAAAGSPVPDPARR